MHKKLLSLSFIAITILLICSAALSIVSFTPVLYTHQFTKHHIYQEFPYPQPAVDAELTTLLHYFYGNTPLHTNFFNQKEQEHLNDVKQLLSTLLLIFYSSFFLFFPFLAHIPHQQRAPLFISASTTTLLLALTLSIITLFNFNAFFLWFHKTTFTNTLWMLNPQTDNLINLFPQAFFYDMFIYTLTLIAFLSISLLFIGIFHLKHKL